MRLAQILVRGKQVHWISFSKATFIYYSVDSRAAAWRSIRNERCDNSEDRQVLQSLLTNCHPIKGWTNIQIPDKQTLITDASKLAYLDSLLTRLKAQNHRVLIYSQMTRVIDLLEEYMWHRKYRYMRLDGSSKISARRDMVADFQSREDIFVFLLSTRAGGLGINLTAADTVRACMAYFAILNISRSFVEGYFLRL